MKLLFNQIKLLTTKVITKLLKEEYITKFSLKISPFFSNKNISYLNYRINLRYQSLIGISNNFFHNKKVIHYLHIGKTGGTSFKRAIKNADICYDSPKNNKHELNYLIKTHPHRIKLSHIPINDKYIISIRDPISRYYSSFYCRKREGKPKYHNRHNEFETIVFNTFDHANTLAESLSSNNRKLRKLAITAMLTIRHVKAKIGYWITVNQLKKHQPFFILEQENLKHDFEKFKSKIDFHDMHLPSDAIHKHANDYSNTPELTPLAIKNLRAWYHSDITIYNDLKNLKIIINDA